MPDQEDSQLDTLKDLTLNKDPFRNLKEVQIELKDILEMPQLITHKKDLR